MNSLAQTKPAINFSRSDLNLVANRAIGIVGTDRRWVEAINRAMLNLATGRFVYDGHVVTLHSASSETVYRIDVREPMICTCKGRAHGYKCWHIVASRLIVRAAEYHAELLAASMAVTVAYKVKPMPTAKSDPNWPTEAEARRNPAPRRTIDHAAAQSAADQLFA